ncbi:SDR family NAD(P)-dependent oxidoreductase, partial [Aphanothece stagnina]|uniref:SDR family NAD(P)-dependent oxidoreductase n=1 Tax=Aphanothece stagnina TaxID=1004305 RepID=UPI00398E5581
ADAGAIVAADADLPGASHVVAPCADAARTVAMAVQALGGLDILVLSARPVKNRPIFDTPVDDIRRVAEEDMIAPAALMLEAARHMSGAGFGRIVVLATMSAKTGVHHNVAPYAAAKAGLLAFARVLAAETAEHGVTVNGIATSLFAPQVATMTADKRDRLRAGVPVGRFGESHEAAHAVLFLVAREGGYVTGECLNLSGGRFMD